MSRVVLTEQASSPPTPTTGKVRVYVGTDGRLKSIDDAGLVTDYAASDPDLAAIAGLSGTGFVALTGPGTAALRTMTGTAGEISVANGDAVSGNPIFSLVNAGTAGTYGSASQVPVFVTDAKGRVTSVTNTGITVTSAAVSDFAEAAQDAVGGILADTSSIDFTYNDAGNAISAVVLPAGVNHNALANYVANQHVDHSTVSISAGAGLTGGGDITASRTISMPNVGTAGTYGSASQVPVFTTDGQGRVSGVTNTPISIASTAVSDFTEAVQDVVGGLLTDSASVDFTYNDAGNSLSAVVLPGGVNHNLLLNYVANQHVDHSAVTISAGTGLTGGGDLTANRTISMPAVGTAGTYGSASQVPVFTTDAQGRVSGVTNTTIAIASAAVTDFTEAVQDVVGAFLTDSPSIDFTYNDAGNTASAALTPTGVAAGTYGGGGNLPVITVDNQGRVTSASEVSVSAVFGSEAEHFSDTTTATTTSTTFASGASWTTASKPVGTYRVGVFFSYAHNNTTGDTRFRVMVDGVQRGPELRREVSETANQSFWGHAFFYVDFASIATHTITIQFAVETAGQTTSLFQAFSEIWRVS